METYCALTLYSAFTSPSDAIAKSAQQVKGTISCDSQFHFHMETQVLRFTYAVATLKVRKGGMLKAEAHTYIIAYTLSCLSLQLLQTSFVIPEAEGYTVYSSTQWPQLTQAAVAAVLGINNSRWVCHW